MTQTCRSPALWQSESMTANANRRKAVHGTPGPLRKCEGPVVGQGGDAGAGLCDFRRVDVGRDDAGLFAGLSKDHAPRVDDEAVAVGAAAVLMLAGLGGRDDEAAGLDRARALQHVPVREARGVGEGRGDRQERGAGFGERAIELWKAQIVADRHAKLAPRQLGDDRAFASAVAARFAIYLAARQADVEHVDFVVPGDDSALRVDQERAVRALALARLDGERAD